jgi:hypothetical protein
VAHHKRAGLSYLLVANKSPLPCCQASLQQADADRVLSLLLPLPCSALSSLAISCSCLAGSGGDNLSEVVLGLPRLRQLRLEGSVWDAAAVRAVLGLQAALQRRGAPWVRLEVV